MKLNELVKSKGLKDKAPRKGRGNSSKGNTCGRGEKGQKSRSGHSMRLTFEGGQTPLVQRLPKKRGFTRYFKLIDNYEIINLVTIESDNRITGNVSKNILIELGYIKFGDKVKLLGNGDFSKKIKFIGIDKFSSSAIEKIEKAGGEIIEGSDEVTTEIAKTSEDDKVEIKKIKVKSTTKSRETKSKKSSSTKKEPKIKLPSKNKK